MKKKICVFCASSNGINPRYHAQARELGRLLALNNLSLVYGGGKVGLMGSLARSVHAHGGKVIGVIPKLFREKGWCYEKADQVKETGSMPERKLIMQTTSDAFIALPGGLGTLDEILEIITAKQLGFHHKLMVLINTNNFFNPLLRLFNSLARKHFINKEDSHLFILVKNSKAAVDFILKGFKEKK
jgi:uncharacterized protein (TIGR00730 family)